MRKFTNRNKPRSRVPYDASSSDINKVHPRAEESLGGDNNKKEQPKFINEKSKLSDSISGVSNRAKSIKNKVKKQDTDESRLNLSNIEDLNMTKRKAFSDFVSKFKKLEYLAYLGFGIFTIWAISSVSRIGSYEIIVNGDKVVNIDSIYHETANFVASDNLLGTWKWFYPSDELKIFLSDGVVEVSEVSISRSLFDSTVVVELMESRPELVYSSERGDFLINEAGEAYQEVIDNEAIPNSSKVVDASGLVFELDDAVLGSATIRFIDQLNGLFQRDSKYKVDYYRLTSTERFLELEIKNQNYYLKLNSNRPAESQYRAFVEFYQQKGELNDVVSEYIDLRIDGRAVYK